MKRKPVSRLILLIFLLCWPLAVLVVWQFHAPSPHILRHPFYNYNVTAQEPQDPQQICLLPRYHPFDPSVLPYLNAPRPRLSCRVRQPNLTFVDTDGIVRSLDSTASCVYQTLIRLDDDTIDYKPEEPLPTEGIQITSDFISVTCRNSLGINIYSNLHAHPRHVDPRPKACPSCPNYNILIFGIDSMSRYGMLRLLPQTFQYLTHNLSANIFRGFTKVADNTYPNLGAMLTGLNIYGKTLMNLPYDDWPLIWKNFSRAGYLSLFAEDFPKFGLFNYPVSGLTKIPSDFYLRPYWLAIESSALYKMSSHMCFGNVPKHIVQMDYLKRFIRQYKNMPFFLFSMLSELSHEYISLVTTADEDILDFLKFLKEEGILDNTVLIVMGDHGPRFGAMLETKIGRIEERLPMFSLVIPESLKQSQSQILENLKINEGRLTSHYDTHSTFLDLLKLATIPGHRLGNLIKLPGSSLFGTISANRTCDDAAIPEHYCVCDREIEVTKETPSTKTAALRLVEAINQLVRDNAPENMCATLKLAEVMSAHRVLPFQAEPRLRIVIRTTPGDALFEGTLTATTVLDGVSRLNRYNGQSDCVHHAILRKFCYCNQQPSPETI